MARSKILLVEDNRNALKGLTRVLSEKYVVFPHANHEEALHLLKSGWRYSLAIVDLTPEGADAQVDDYKHIVGGEDIIRYIKHSRRPIPVIAISGSDRTGRVKGYGEDAYIQKPVDPKILLSQIEGLLLTHH